MEFLTRFKNALFLIAVLLTQAIALAVQVRAPVNPSEPDRGGVRLIRLWAAATVTPFERFAHAIGSATHFGWSDYVDLRHVRRQNQELQQQLTRMRIEQAAIAEDALQGRRLQALLGFREQYIGATVAAQVIGSSGSEQSRVLIIDKGSRDGLRPDMAVITPDGIVGKLRDVFPNTAQVLEINDQTSGAGVILASTRIRAILSGGLAGQVQIANLTPDSRIKPGEQVLTSGGDQVFPRGLPVGTIQSIATDPDPDRQPYTRILVRPAADLNRVDEVLVITGTQGDLPPATEQDLAAAEAQHAADLTADKLPGIHDDQPTAGTGAAPTPATAPGTAPGAVPASAPPVHPHPLPALHPDKYSSGSVPPAAEMTPGAANAPPPPLAAATQPAAARPRNQPGKQPTKQEPPDSTAPEPPK
jgi:rod shape-determining protein MreC